MTMLNLCSALLYRSLHCAAPSRRYSSASGNVHCSTHLAPLRDFRPETAKWRCCNCQHYPINLSRRFLCSTWRTTQYLLTLFLQNIVLLGTIWIWKLSKAVRDICVKMVLARAVPALSVVIVSAALACIWSCTPPSPRTVLTDSRLLELSKWGNGSRYLHVDLSRS